MSIFNILVFHLLFHIFHLYLHVLFPSTFITLIFLIFKKKNPKQGFQAYGENTSVYLALFHYHAHEIFCRANDRLSHVHEHWQIQRRGFGGCDPPPFEIWKIEKKNIFVNCMRYVYMYLVVHTRRYAMRPRYQYVVRMTYFICVLNVLS